MSIGKWIEFIQLMQPKMGEALPHILALLRIFGAQRMQAGRRARQERVDVAQQQELKRLLVEGGAEEAEAEQLSTASYEGK